MKNNGFALIIAAILAFSGTASLQAQVQQNGLLREVYENIAGTSLANLTNHATFPGSPTSENIVSDYFESPTDIMENYGQRMRALLLPPVTGNYTFWIATDDAGGLFLSTDDKPANARLISWVSTWTPPRQWGKEASQKSAAIRLESGKKYYIEALMKEGGGGDNLAVRWQLPDGTMEEPIPASRLQVYGLGPPVITQAPQNVSVLEGGTATFTLQLNRTSGAIYQWKRNGADLAGATNATLLFGPATLSDNGSRFSCAVTNSQGGTLSQAAILTVSPDTIPPTVDTIVNLGNARVITVVFSEPVDAVTGLNPAFYTLDQGVTVLSAKYAGDTRSVLLQTSPLNTGTLYTLTVNGVKDRATTPNMIALNTRRTFRIERKPLDSSVITGLAEPLGPSNRRWGVVVSEIMYHPAERADGRNLQYLEIFNTFDWPENVSGWRLDGSIQYRIPDNTIIPKRGFLVVAPVPEDIKAVYGINNVIGGFSGKLPNNQGQVRLRNTNNVVIFDALYSSRPPFPAAADGAGHSLVLWRPSYGEGQPEAWGASEWTGGSPGAQEPAAATPYRSVLINEVLTHTDDPQLDFVELFNYSSQAVDVAGCILTDNPATNKFVIPPGTVIPPMDFVAFEQNQMGFALRSSGETVWLFNPSRLKVIDSLRLEAQANGVSYGRTPDGSPDFQELISPTPARENSQALTRDIVINEIMYRPISGDKDDEYVELYNQGDRAVDLSRWRFVDGIDFRFPEGTVMAPSGYLVVARKAARLKSNYPNLNEGNTVGDYQGSLGNSGERLALAMPHPVLTTNLNGQITTDYVYVVVDEVAYERGGRWPRWANEGGSSLELIDPRADNRRASNWADSDETAKSDWTTIQHTGVLDNGNGGYPPNQLQMGLLGLGECLVDEVEVLRSGGPNLVSNPSFEAGLASWTLQGNHKGSAPQSSGGVNGSACLHLVAAGRVDTGANRIRTPLTGLRSGDTVTLRAKVRWLRGWPEFLLRTRGNWLEAAGRLEVPSNLGTPGARNSRAAANTGPAIFAVSHSPVLPNAGQAVTVRARVDDPDGLASIVLRYRLDPATNDTVVSMTNHGAGYFSAAIPGQSAGVLAAFWLQAVDASSAPAVTFFPAEAPARECLVRFGEPRTTGNFGAYRLWLTQKTVQTWASREKLNNAPLDGTFVYGDGRVIYNMGALYAGSPFISPGYNSPVGGLCGYVFEFPEDDLCLNSTDFTLDWPTRDGTAQVEQVALWMVDQLGSQGGYRRFIHLYVNGNRRGAIYEDCFQPNGDMVEAMFPEDEDGNLHKVDDWFEFDDAASSFSNVDATLQNFTTTGGAKKMARYRWNWRPRAVRRSANEFAPLFALVDAMNTSDANLYTARVNDLINVRDWMSVFAVEHIMVNWDSYGFNRGKNMYTYKPQNGRWVMLPWDIDFFMGSVNQDVFATGDPTISRMYNHPPFRRIYFQALQDAATGPMEASVVNPLMDARYAALTANGISVSSPSSAKTWMANRRAFLLDLIAKNNALFAITSNQGQNFSTNSSLASLSGTAPLEVRQITLNGVEYPLTWTTVSNWTAKVALQNGANTLQVQGFDRLGRPYPGSQATITITSTAAAESPVGKVVINEIMYHPAAPNAAYLELYNHSAETSFDLSRWRLNGLDFTIPDGTILGPQNYLVIAEDRLAFVAAYGATIPVVGEYEGQMDRGGETLSLIKPGAAPSEEVVVDQVTYNDAPPWPAQADGQGPSLQLIDPGQDNRRVGNWAASATNAPLRYTPGTVNQARASLPPFPELWINEVQPENLNGPADAQGNRVPWIELYNSSAEAIPLAGLFLTDNYSHLTQWPFPANSVIPARSFLVIWADGKPEQTTAGELHASFRLAPGAGSVALVQSASPGPMICDYINYRHVLPDRAYGAYPDGQPRTRQAFYYPTPGGTNNPAQPPLHVVFNEWMAGNSYTAADPADGHYEDWFELYNGGAETADLSRYHLSDSPTNHAKFIIPDGTVIPPGEFLLVWADEETGQNAAGSAQLHVNFKLSLNGETLGLFAPDGALVDQVPFGVQTNDISQGRWPDGADPLFWMDLPTPGAPNRVASSNLPPVLTVPTSLAVLEGERAVFKATATDPNEGQVLRFNLGHDAPTGAWIDPITGDFNWTPSEAHGPGTYSITVRVSDNGDPAMTASKRVAIQVDEFNIEPSLAAIDSQTVEEGQRLNLVLAASDPDLPPQKLTFSLEPNSPAGATVDANTGEFSFTPTEEQGPGVYTVTVRVRDSAAVPLSARRSFQITVLEVNRPPVVPPIPDQIAFQTETLAFRVEATDEDRPRQILAFSLEAGAPAGAVIDRNTGEFSWTPSDLQAPSTNTVVVRVSDNGTPPLSNSRAFKIVAARLNRPPVLSPLPDQQIDEGSFLQLILAASDPDTGQTLSYRLEPGAPAGLALDASSGLLTWSPGESAGPGAYPVTITVADNGSPSRADSQSFQIAVREVNSPPALPTLEDQTIGAGETLSLRLNAADADLPANTLSYRFDSPAPEGMTLDARTGEIRWTPQALQAPGTNTIAVSVTDNGSPALSDQRVFTIVVCGPPPWQYFSATGTSSSSTLYIYLTRPGDLYLDDLQIVRGIQAGVGSNVVANGDFEKPLAGSWTVSPNHARSMIVSNVARSGRGSLHLVATTGGTTRASSVYKEIVPALPNNAPYTLSFWCLPGTNQAELTIRLSGAGITTTQVINRPATNRPPVLAALADFQVEVGQRLSFTASANDPDAGHSLHYSLSPDAPAGAMIDPVNGAFSWIPGASQAGQLVSMAVRVVDSGYPPRSDTEVFRVQVNGIPTVPRITGIEVHPEYGVRLFWEAEPGVSYQVQCSDRIDSPQWQDLGQPITPSGNEGACSDPATGAKERFYRVMKR